MPPWIDWLTPPLDPGLRPTVGLVLTGGGARSAYQVGVLHGAGGVPAAGAQSLPGDRRHLRRRGGRERAGRRGAPLAPRGRGPRARLGELPLQPGLPRRHAATCCAPARTGCCRSLSGGLVLSPPQVDPRQHARCANCSNEHVDCAGIRRSIARGHLRAFALCATSYTQRPVGLLLRRGGVDPRLVARAARRQAHRTHPRSPDGERRHPAAVPADEDRQRLSSATVRCASSTP